MKHAATTNLDTNNQRHLVTQRANLSFLVVAALILLPGCGAMWDSFSLDTGANVGLPLVGVDAAAHCKLDLGKREESDEKPADALTGDERLALLRMQFPADGVATRDVEGEH